MLSITELKCSRGRTQILNGVEFSLVSGERVGIIGPNGSGKTTLFNCISGFNAASGGKILFKGNDITALDPHKRAALGLGRVFQNPGIFKEMSLVENLVTALESHQSGIAFPWSRITSYNRERARDFLRMVKLEAKADEKAGSLSGGQMRLLEIVRAIACDADLYLLDEPTAGVSPRMKDEVQELLLKLHEMNKTVLVIEHDLGFIQKICERIIVLDQGRVVLDGTPEKVRNDPMLQELYFGAIKGSASA